MGARPGDRIGEKFPYRVNGLLIEIVTFIGDGKNFVPGCEVMHLNTSVFEHLKGTGKDVVEKDHEEISYDSAGSP